MRPLNFARTLPIELKKTLQSKIVTFFFFFFKVKGGIILEKAKNVKHPEALFFSKTSERFDYFYYFML